MLNFYFDIVLQKFVNLSKCQTCVMCTQGLFEHRQTIKSIQLCRQWKTGGYIEEGALVDFHHMDMFDTCALLLI